MKISDRGWLVTGMALRASGILLIVASGAHTPLIFMGLCLAGLSFLLVPARKRGDLASQQLATYSTLLTVAIILLLIGISWLTFLGMAAAVLSGFFSLSRPASYRSLAPLLVLLAAALFELLCEMAEGTAFLRRPTPHWYVALLSALWVWAVFSGYRHWCARRSAQEGKEISQ